MKRLAVVLLLVLLLACPLLGVLGLRAAAAYQHNHALALQAQATLAQATATQTLAFTQLALLVLGGGVVFLMALAAVGLGVALWMGQRAKPKWAPGPNAGWRRMGETPRPPSSLPDLNTLITLALAERLFPAESLPPAYRPALPESTGGDDPEEDTAWPWFTVV